jgi:tripartite ATP-independent transporter DctM subunit
MCAAHDGSHLSIGFIQYVKSEKIKRVLKIITGLLAVFITTILAWTAASFIKIALLPAKPVFFFITDAAFAFVMPLGYAVIAVRFALKTPLYGTKRIIPFLAILLGCFFALPSIARIVWGFNEPDFIFAINNFLLNAVVVIRTPAVILLLVSALAGIPLFTVISGLALLLIQSSGGEISVVANQIYTSLTNDSIIAIPLFTLTGFFLSESKAGERLVAAFRAIFGWIPGGLIILSVIICAFFTSFTGASGVTILALGGILFSVLSENSTYKKSFSIGLLASCGSIGLLFPPSIPILLVGASAQINTLHLFLGGIIPGIMLSLAMVVFGIIVSIKTKIPRDTFQLKKAALSLKHSAFELLLPVFLIGGYFSGILSAVEIGAASVIYVFIVEVLIYKDIKLKDLKTIFAKTMPIIGGILSILAVASSLSYYIVDTQAPENFARWMQNVIRSPIAFLLILNLALLVVGCLVDIFSAILIVLPLIVPLGAAYGIDPVHLGIIFLINLEAGFLTPPVGLNLFFASYRFEKPFVDICRYVFPFLLIQLAVVLLVTFVPFFSTFLVDVWTSAHAGIVP